MVRLFLFVSALVPITAEAAPKSVYVADYPVDAAVVARGVQAWYKERGLTAISLNRPLASANPFLPFDGVGAFDLDVQVGPLGFRVPTAVHVTSTGLGATRVELTLAKTNTLGEGAAWKQVGTDFIQDLAAYVAAAQAPRSGDDLIAAARNEMANPDTCASTGPALVRSPYPEAAGVLSAALDVAPPGCVEPLLSSMGASSTWHDSAAGWLAARFRAAATPEQRADLISLIRPFRDPTPDLVAILTADKARAAAEALAVDQATADASTARQAAAVRKVKAYEGPWHVQTDVSPVDDTVNTYAWRTANNSINGWPGVVFRPELWARCKEGVTEVYIVVGMPPAVEVQEDFDTEQATVLIRLDADLAQEVLATKSTDGRALVLDGGSEFAAELAGHKSLFVRFIPFNSAPAEMTFDLAGLDLALEPVRLACGW